MIAAEGHVGDDHGAMHGAADGAGVVQHLVHGDGEGGIVTENDHGEGVADEDEVDAGLVDEARGRVIVCGEAGDGDAREFLVLNGLDGDFGGAAAGLGRGARVTRGGDAHGFSSAALVVSDRMQPANESEYTPWGIRMGRGLLGELISDAEAEAGLKLLAVGAA